jgi:putative FmdB family regulatory protein
MPLYEYECRACGERFEKLQPFGASAPETCPKGHRQVHRLLSQPAIIFKGSGFYVTDNGRNGSRSNASIPAGEGASGTGDKEGSATESASGGKASSKAENSTGS